jgi:pilus assembly protein CpaB
LKTRLLTITLAAVLAMLGLVAVLAYVHQANERAVNGLKAETVIVASDPITAGTSLSEAKAEHELSNETVPVSSLSAGAVQYVTNANEHQVVSADVAKGQVLFQDMLAKAGSVTLGSSGPVLPLPKGDIGVTMEICLDADVAGYPQPGSYIAVFDTYPTSGSMTYTCTSHQAQGKALALARIIVNRVEVLSVTPVSPQGNSSTAVDADPTNQASLVTNAGEVLVTLAATSQIMGENLTLINTAGDPTFGLLTPTSVTKDDGPANGALEFPQP